MPEEITFWVRAANETKSRALADAYNATHPSQVVVTAFPDDQLPTRVGTATSSGDVPDLLASDIVFMPQFLEAGVYLDITERVESLDFHDQLFPQLLTAATGSDGTIYAVPRDPGTSMLFWNKDLFRQAGLDPEQAPASWEEIASAAAEIAALGGDAEGFYFAGNCSGCLGYTFVPLVWASGGDVLDETGAPTLDSPEMQAALDFYQRLWDEGSVPQGAQTDNGSNWLTGFAAGNVGILPAGSFAIAGFRDANIDFGIGFLPGQSGGEGSFAGGDVIGIPAAAEHPDAAWDFISWTLSEEVQLEHLAQNGELVARRDLVDNEFSEAEPAVRLSNDALAFARTPLTTSNQAIFADPNGPFIGMLQRAVFQGEGGAAAEEAQQQAQSIHEGN